MPVFCAMVETLFLHSILRWLVLVTLAWALLLCLSGHFSKRKFRKWDQIAVRTASTTCYVQLFVGFVLYYRSPIVHAFWVQKPGYWSDATYFAVVHILLMSTAMVLITIGSSTVKRKIPDSQRFKAVVWYYGLGLCLILLLIPWPFSPLAARPFWP